MPLGLFKKYSDNALLEGLRRQDNKILEYLYNTYFEMVRDYVKKNSGNEEDAYDVLQEAVVILFKQVREKDFQLTSDLKGYFFGIARNIWNVQLRKKIKVSELDTEIADDDFQFDAGQATMERIVSRSFNLLKEDCQKIIKFFMDGISFEDIAIKMGLKNETYARRKKYLCKEALMNFVKSDSEYQDLGTL